MDERYENSLQLCRSDSEEIENGRWVPFRGMELKIARYNNRKYLEVYIAELKKGSDAEAALLEAAAVALLTDWRGVYVEEFDDKGNTKKIEIKYTLERCRTVLKNDIITNDFVHDYAQKNENFIQRGLLRIKKK